MLEPGLALRLRLCPSLWRGWVSLSWQIVQVCPSSDSETAVIVVDKGEPIHISELFLLSFSGVYLLESHFRPVLTVTVRITAEEQFGQNCLNQDTERGADLGN